MEVPQIQIPVETTSITVLIRHAPSVQSGPNEQRTLAPKGIALCSKVQGYWNLVRDMLARLYGDPEYGCSTFPRSELTLWEIFHPERITRDAGLNNITSLKKIQGGAWFTAQKAAGRTVPQMVFGVLRDPSLQEGQPFVDAATAYKWYIINQACRFRFAVCHEPHLSQAADGLIPDEQLGFNECEGAIFYASSGLIIGAQKLVPNSAHSSLPT